MIDISQQSVVVSGSIDTANVVVTVSNARGPEGPEGPSGASTWDEISGTASSIPFEPVTPPAYAEGLVFYDTDDKSLTYYNDEADVSMNLGREMWVRVRNDSGATIANGKVVYINDAQGQLPTIRLARADAEATSRVIGIATHDIENNSDGYVTTSGMVKGLNTSAFQDGDLLFLSAATAGEMTTTAPTAPNRAVQVAIVAHAHVSQGKLYCHPENDSVASTGIVDSTSTGRSILTAANAAAARTALGSGATGDALFTAPTPAVARTELGFDGMVPKVPFTVSLESDFTTASTSFVNATGLSFEILANKSYAVSYYILTNKNDTSGLAIQFTGPAATNRISFRQFVGTTSFANAVFNLVTAFSTASTTFNTFAGDSFATATTGIISNGPNAGTVQLQIRAVTGGTARIYAGSYIQITEL